MMFRVFFSDNHQTVSLSDGYSESDDDDDGTVLSGSVQSLVSVSSVGELLMYERF